MLLQVEGHKGLVRDSETNAIINTNNVDYLNYLKQRDRAQSVQEQIQLHGTEINSIKEDIGQIKDMLTALLNKTV